MNIIIIGAGAAGRLAAKSAKKTKPDANVILIGKEPNAFVRCSAPYCLSGENKLEDLIKPSEFIQDEVIKVDTENKIIKTKTKTYSYDSLIFATGASPFVPLIKDAEKAFVLRTSEDTRKIYQASKNAKKAVIIGAGAIGIEVAEAFAKRGIKTKIIEMMSHVLAPILDDEFCEAIENKLRENKIEILLNTKIDKIPEADLAIIAAGVKSNTELAEKAGIKVDKCGIKVNEFLQTNIKNIYAAGDCACSSARLAPRAVLEGKIAGRSAAGAKIDIHPTISPFTLEIFDLAIGSVGMIEKKAKEKKIKIMVGRAKSLSKHDSFKDAKPIQVKLIFNQDRKIIGGAVMGEEGVAQRLNLISLAIQKKCLIGDLVKLEYTSYPKLTPLPFAEPIVMAAESVCKQVHGKEVW